MSTLSKLIKLNSKADEIIHFDWRQELLGKTGAAVANQAGAGALKYGLIGTGAGAVAGGVAGGMSDDGSILGGAAKGALAGGAIGAIGGGAYKGASFLNRAKPISEAMAKGAASKKAAAAAVAPAAAPVAPAAAPMAAQPTAVNTPETRAALSARGRVGEVIGTGERVGTAPLLRTARVKLPPNPAPVAPAAPAPSVDPAEVAYQEKAMWRQRDMVQRNSGRTLPDRGQPSVEPVNRTGMRPAAYNDARLRSTATPDGRQIGGSSNNEMDAEALNRAIRVNPRSPAAMQPRFRPRNNWQTNPSFSARERRIIRLNSRLSDVISFAADPRPRNPQGEFSGDKDAPNPQHIQSAYQPRSVAQNLAGGAVAGVGATASGAAIKAMIDKIKKMRGIG